MKKIPTLFTRIFEGRRIVGITPEITPGCEEAFLNGVATVKIDGSCCAIIDGEFYKRYDAKKGKKPPEGAIPCCEPDPVTGHHPHWVKVDSNDPSDKWFVKAFENLGYIPGPGTYEAVGPHFNGNPYGLDNDVLEPHGFRHATISRKFDDIRDYLENNVVEGLVFWLDGEPVCKIKRSDFGFKWPVKD
jgi:hypothetical protein